MTKRRIYSPITLVVLCFAGQPLHSVPAQQAAYYSFPAYAAPYYPRYQPPVDYRAYRTRYLYPTWPQSGGYSRPDAVPKAPVKQKKKKPITRAIRNAGCGAK